MRKSLAIVVSVIILVAWATTASAATVNDILQALGDAGVPEVYVLQAESYMADKTISPATADAVIVHINNAAAIADGETKISALSGEQKSDIAVEFAAACALLNLRAEFGDHNLTVYDDSDRIVFIVTAEEAIKHTGYDYNIAIYGALILLLAVISIFVVKRIPAARKS
ncbi:MAG TPA: hypothetical protein PLP30_05510 [Clostridia bacterium]|nr:hypothetical protein [Clostridia bacterium]HPQ46803.1 hypothetical protein [Clostridia bacterium]